MSAYLALVMESAERHAYILALHGCCNRLSERCLAHSRRSVEADDGRLEVASELQYSHIFEYAFLHLLHSVMVAVEYALCTLQVEIVLGILAPRQIDHCLQIVELNAVVGALRIEHVELVEFLSEHLLHVFAPKLCLGFLFQFLALGRTLTVAQFLLDILNLLLQEVLTLLLVEVFASLRAYVLLEFEQLHFLVHHAQHADDALLDT